MVEKLGEQIDAAILGLNPLTGHGEDYIWRPADKARAALIAAREEIKTLRRQLQSRERSANLWHKTAEKALTALPGASNSSHPAHGLWLRVELAKQPPVEVTLS